MRILDPATGQIVDVPDNVASLPYQTGRATVLSNTLAGQLPVLQQQEQQAITGQQGLVKDLNGVIQGTAPSVAQTQLAQTSGQIAQQAASQAGSVAGPNSALAAYLGQIQASMARAKANQDAANLRAQEVAQARQAKGQVLGQEANEANQATGTAVSGATGLTNTATGGASTDAQIQAQRDMQNKQLIANIIAGLGSGAATSLGK